MFSFHILGWKVEKPGPLLHRRTPFVDVVSQFSPVSLVTIGSIIFAKSFNLLIALYGDNNPLS
jgi:hypothetical protein